MNKSAKEMFEKLGYKLDKETRFGATVSYTKYCSDYRKRTSERKGRRLVRC